jgi:hypothetical protein
MIEVIKKNSEIIKDTKDIGFHNSNVTLGNESYTASTINNSEKIIQLS